MERVYLKVPFIRHYAGSVFELVAPIYATHEGTEQLFDERNSFQKKVYWLPDDGKGSPTKLHFDCIAKCPDALFSKFDLRSGPCRITSVSTHLKQPVDDPFYADPLPLGMGRVLLENSAYYPKNCLKIGLPDGITPDMVLIKNELGAEAFVECHVHQRSLILDFSNYAAGFYSVQFLKEQVSCHHFTMIKCFPFTVQFDPKTRQLMTIDTIW